MAVSRSGKTATSADQKGVPGAATRVSFAKIREPLEVPNLLALQTSAFDWLVGNEAWKSRNSDTEGLQGGLAEILDEISPIEDFSGSMSLSFSNPRFEDVKASIEECKDKDMTYAAPLFVTAEFTNNTTGEIKSQPASWSGAVTQRKLRSTRPSISSPARAPMGSFLQAAWC